MNLKVLIQKDFDMGPQHLWLEEVSKQEQEEEQEQDYQQSNI